MYTDRDFKTKKELKEHVERYNKYLKEQAQITTTQGFQYAGGMTVGDLMRSRLRVVQPVGVFQPNSDITGATVPENGEVSVEGPHFPRPHTWYARVTLKDGAIVKVR